MSRAGYLHKVAIGLEPSHRASTLGAGVGVVVCGALLTAGLQLDSGSWPDGWPRPPVPPPVLQVALAVLAAVACLALVAAVVHGRRWRTYRRIVRITADPGVVGLLPDIETEPAGPFAPPQPSPHVIFEKVPAWKAVRPRERVSRDRNVVGRPPLQIVYLRVFENGARARTFVKGAWREFGHVRLLRSAASVSPAELRRSTQHGRLTDLVIDSEQRFRSALARPTGEIEAPGWHRLHTVAGAGVSTYDRYGAYPVRALMCAGGFWKRALEILLEQADLVVLDLSGYDRHYRGTQFELQRIVDAVPVERVLLLADPYSRTRFLEQQIDLAWSRMAAGSPNAGRGLLTLRGAITDHFVRHESRSAAASGSSGSGSSGSTSSRLELRASRRQTRWLLRDVQMRLRARSTLSPRPAPPAVRATRPTPSTAVRPVGPPPPRRARPARPWPLLTMILVVVALGLAALHVTGRVPAAGTAAPVAPVPGTAATVAPGTEWNVRSGPSTSAAVVGQVAPGAEVVVACTTGGWARLVDPPGSYVSAKGLRTAGTPPGC